MDAGKLGLAESIAVVVAQRLGDLGFEVEVLKNVSGPADDPGQYRRRSYRLDG
ncbi:MAG: hypothetical protein WDM77_12205 [Steroidobacteraceae bacterium]